MQMLTFVLESRRTIVDFHVGVSAMTNEAHDMIVAISNVDTPLCNRLHVLSREILKLNETFRLEKRRIGKCNISYTLHVESCTCIAEEKILFVT